MSLRTDLKVPFYIRGPGIAPGSRVAEISLNVDVGATIAELLGTAPPADALVDGHSLLPLLTAPAAERPQWRDDFVFEFWAGGQPGGPATPGSYCSHNMMAPNNTYQGVRTASGLKYVDFSPHEQIEEAFNLTADPFEMRNLAASASTAPPWIDSLRARLAVLRNCSLEACWSGADTITALDA